MFKIVLIRWAITIRVFSLKTLCMICCIRSTVLLSSVDVGSSITITRLFWRRARANERSWRCPELKRLLTVPMEESRCMECERNVGVSERRERTSHISASERWWRKSRLSLRDPEKRGGSCGIIAREWRSIERGTEAMSMPSMRIDPRLDTPSSGGRGLKGTLSETPVWGLRERGERSELSSTRRKRGWMREDLPAPVRPQIPMCSCGWIMKEMLESANGRWGR